MNFKFFFKALAMVIAATLMGACAYVPKDAQLVNNKRDVSNPIRISNLGNYSKLKVGMPEEEVKALFPKMRLYWQSQQSPDHKVFKISREQKYVTRSDWLISNAANIAAKKKNNPDLMTPEQEDALHRGDAQEIYKQNLQQQQGERVVRIQAIKPKVTTDTGYFEFKNGQLFSWE